MAKKSENLEEVDIDAIFDKLDKSFGTYEETKYVKTGLLPFDMVLGSKGIPLGKMIELASESGLGKSTIMMQVCKKLCDQGYQCLWIDSEYASDTDILGKMGLLEHINSGKFRFYQKNTFSEIEEILDPVLPTKKVHFVVIDSLTNITSLSRVQSTTYNKEAVSVDKALMASDARLQSVFLKKYKRMVAEAGCTMFFINQMRASISMGFSPAGAGGPKHAGGKAVKFNMDAIIDIINVGQIKEKQTILGNEDNRSIGNNLYLMIKEKSRVCVNNIKVPTALYKGKGLSSVVTLQLFMEGKKVDIGGKETPMIKQSKQTFTVSWLGKQESVVGKKALYNLISMNYDEILSCFDATDFMLDKDDFDEVKSMSHSDDDVAADLDVDNVVLEENDVDDDGGEADDFE